MWEQLDSMCEGEMLGDGGDTDDSAASFRMDTVELIR
jgi:hypothetical protein